MVGLGEGGWKIFMMRGGGVGGRGEENEGIFPLDREGWAFPKCSPGFVDLQF